VIGEQLPLFAELAESGPAGHNGNGATLSRHAPAGAARLLRDLVKAGLGNEHLKPAAALVLELDARAHEEAALDR
jgi:hypothetical protein